MIFCVYVHHVYVNSRQWMTFSVHAVKYQLSKLCIPFRLFNFHFRIEPARDNMVVLCSNTVVPVM
jgi:hypothetical protein